MTTSRFLPLAAGAFLVIAGCGASGDRPNVVSESARPVALPAVAELSDPDTDLVDSADQIDSSNQPNSSQVPVTSHVTTSSQVPVPSQVPATPTPSVSSEIDDQPEPDDVLSMTPAQLLELASTAELDAVGGYDCALELAAISLGYLHFLDDDGDEASTMTQLVDDGYIEGPLTMWSLDATSAVALPGTPCLGELQFFADYAETCRIEHITLETVIEVFYAQYETDVPPTETEGVELNLLREESENYDIVDGEIVAVTGGHCDGISFDHPDPPTHVWTDDCEVSRKIFEIAIESFYIENGYDATETGLVDSGFLRSESPDFDIELNDFGDFPTVLVADGSNCV